MILGDITEIYNNIRYLTPGMPLKRIKYPCQHSIQRCSDAGITKGNSSEESVFLPDMKPYYQISGTRSFVARMIR
jgi:hypothetical protein